MSTADERFDLAVQSVENVRSLTKDLSTIGVFDTEEYKAAEVILRSLNRALFILDPERAEEYVKGIVNEVMGGGQAKQSEAGLYL
jgi:hypothetical protein